MFSNMIRLAHGLEDAHGHLKAYDVSSESLYRFSLWAKGDAGRIVIVPRVWPDRGKGDPNLGRFPFWVGREWRRFDGTFTMRADTKGLILLIDVPVSSGDGSIKTLHADDLVIEQLPPGLAGWWQLDGRAAPIARDLGGACPDGAVYRQWHVGE